MNDVTPGPAAPEPDPGRDNYEGYRGQRNAAAGPGYMPEDYDVLPEHFRQAWRAGAHRVLGAAQAECDRLRGLVDEITDDITRKSGVNSPFLLRKAREVRERAGLED